MKRQDTAQDLLAWAQACLAASGIEQPRREARLLMARATEHAPVSWLMGDGKTPIQPVEAAEFRELVGRRAGREPLAHLTGSQGFWNLDLEVSDATLIPRADSEALIESLLSQRPDRERPLRMLDLGTGTGCLLLAALSEFPQAWGVGIDLSPRACALAAANARAAGLGGRCAFLCASWSDAISAPGQGFDLVLSNPPYIPTAEIDSLMPEVGRFEPRLALDGGSDGLGAYRSILSRLEGLLSQGGIAILELGCGQIAEIGPIAAPLGFAIASVHADLGGVARAVTLERARGGQKMFGRQAAQG